MPNLTKPDMWDPGGAEVQLPSPLGGEGPGVRACRGQPAAPNAVTIASSHQHGRTVKICVRGERQIASGADAIGGPSPPAPSPPRGEGRPSPSAYADALVADACLPRSDCRPDLTKPDTGALPGVRSRRTNLTEPDTRAPLGACGRRLDLTKPDIEARPRGHRRDVDLTEPDTWAPPAPRGFRRDLTEPDTSDPLVRQARGGGRASVIERPQIQVRQPRMGEKRR